MKTKSLAFIAIALSCFAAFGGAMLMDSDGSEAADTTYTLTNDSVKVGTAYSKSLGGPGILIASYYTMTGPSWLTLSFVSTSEMKVSGTPTSTGTYNVKVTGPILQGGLTAEWVWTINVTNETTYSVNVYGRIGNIFASATVAAGSTYTLPTLSDNDSYTFNGYYTAASGGSYVGTSGTVLTINSNRDIYSQWSAVVYYSVTVDLNGYYFHPNAQLYVEKSTASVKAGDTFDLTIMDNTTRSNYIYSKATGELVNPPFKGWSTSPNGSVVSYMTFTVTGNVTYYAIWGASEEEDDLTFLGGTNSVIGVAGNSYSYTPGTNIASAVITYTKTVDWLTFSGGNLSGTFPAVSVPTSYNVILTATSTNPVQTVTQSITFYVYPKLAYIGEPPTSMFMGGSYDFDLTTGLSGVIYTLTGVDWLTVHDNHIVGSAPVKEDTYTVTFIITAIHTSSAQSSTKTVILTVNQILGFTTLPTSSFVASQVAGSVQYESFIIDWLRGLFPSSSASGLVDYVFSGNTVKFVFTGTDTENLRWYVNGQLASTDWVFTKTFSNGYYEISCIAENEMGTSEVFSVRISVEQGFMGLTIVDYMIILVVALFLIFVASAVKKRKKQEG